MLAMPDLSEELTDEEIHGLQGILKDAFALKDSPHLAVVVDEENQLGDFRDVVGYLGIPYFGRIDKSTGTLVWKAQQSNHVPINHPPSDEEQGDLYGYLRENQRFADYDLKRRRTENFWEELGF